MNLCQVLLNCQEQHGLFAQDVLLHGQDGSPGWNWGVSNTTPHDIETLSKSLMLVLFEEHFGV